MTARKEWDAKWPACTADVVARVERRIRDGLAAMTPAEREAFWAQMPWWLRPGARRQNCLACGGLTPPAADYCGECAGVGNGDK